MKMRCSNLRHQALTLVEVAVILATVAIFFAMILFFSRAVTRDKREALQINCVNNLKQIGLSFRIWGGDNNDKYPMQITETNSGAREFTFSGDATAIFRCMSNEIGSPKVLRCPEDSSRTAATNFTTDLKGKISYFVNVDASDIYPQMVLIGDDNFAIGGVSVKSGLLEITSNTPIAWTAERHKFNGNIGLADGSVQQLTASGLTNLFQQTGSGTNRLAIP